MSNRDKIEGKLVQALLVWKEQGGPKGIHLSEATAIAAKGDPTITEIEMRSIVNNSNVLALNGNTITLSAALTDLM
jgi:hypothetical protein